MRLDILSRTKTYSESTGYYERVPVRINSFVLVENIKSKVVYQTTSQKFCNDGPILRIVIYKHNNNNWGINIKQGGISSSYLHTDDLSSEKLSRRRAFWHACQYMKGEELNHKERYSKIYQHSNQDVTIFEADSFFKNGNAITTDPFGEFLK